MAQSRKPDSQPVTPEEAAGLREMLKLRLGWLHAAVEEEAQLRRRVDFLLSEITEAVRQCHLIGQMLHDSKGVLEELCKLGMEESPL